MIPPPKEPRIDKSVDYLKIKARRREGNPISDLYYKTKEVETVLNKSVCFSYFNHLLIIHLLS